MLVHSIGIVAFFTLDARILREKVLIQFDFMHQQLLAEVVDVVDQD